MSIKKSKLPNNLEWRDFAGKLRPIIVRKYAIREKNKNIILGFYPGTRTVINQTGKNILEMCDGKNSLKKISETMSSKYKVNQEKTLNDIIFFISQLARYEAVSFKKEDLQKLISNKAAKN